ncbi:uncharacterized protein [Watersipora subatra]|uniref:uncharacterized protein n=1 Tax=Watersipora subatra TaxID=2589382 RepID=UPI00355C647F
MISHFRSAHASKLYSTSSDSSSGSGTKPMSYTMASSTQKKLDSFGMTDLDHSDSLQLSIILSSLFQYSTGSGIGGLRLSSSSSLAELDNTSYGFELPEFFAQEEGSSSSSGQSAPAITWPLPAALQFMLDAGHLATLRAAEPKNLTWPVMEEELPDSTSTPSSQPLPMQSAPYPPSHSKSSPQFHSSTPRSVQKKPSPHLPSPSKSSPASPSSTYSKAPLLPSSPPSPAQTGTVTKILIGCAAVGVAVAAFKLYK